MPITPRRQSNILRTLAIKLNKLNKASLQSKPDPSNKDLLATLRNVIFFVALYSYFAGWVYSYYLYYHFGISLYSLDIPFYYFFIYSYQVFYSNIWLLLLIFAVLVLILILRKSERERMWITIIFLLILFPLCFQFARRRALGSALLLRQGYGERPVVIAFKTKEGYPPELLEANDKGNLWLLTQTKDRYYVFYQPAPLGNELPRCYTYVIASNDVNLIKVKGKNISNDQVKIDDVPR